MKILAMSSFYKNKKIEEILPLYKEIGYDGVEIWSEHLSNANLYAIRQISKKNNVLLTVHAPSYDINPLSDNYGIRFESQKQIKENLEKAKKIGARVYVVHPGNLSSSKSDKNMFFERLKDFAYDLGILSGGEITVTVELMERRPKEFFITAEDAAEFMKEKIKNVFLTVDIAHLFTFNEDPLNELKKIEKEWIKHIHLSDSLKNPVHLPLGKGNINIREIVFYLKEWYHGCINIEGYVLENQYEILKKNLEYLKRLGI